MTKVECYQKIWTSVVKSLLPQFGDDSPKLIELWNSVFKDTKKTGNFNTDERQKLYDEIMVRVNNATEDTLPSNPGDKSFILDRWYHDIQTGEEKEIEKIPIFRGFNLVKVFTWPNRMRVYLEDNQTKEQVLWRETVG